MSPHASTTPSSESHRPDRTRQAAGSAALLIVGILTGCASHHAPSTNTVAAATASPSPTATLLTLQPIVQLRAGTRYSPNYTVKGTSCSGTNGYDDLGINKGVTLYTANGDVAGTGFITKTLVDGKLCDMLATVHDVIPARYYMVQIGNRNKVAFSLKELQNETAVLTFG